jgi:hypothetical protein
MTRIGSGNVKVTLPLHSAAGALTILTDHADTLGLQEWGNQRNRLLTATGSLHKGPFVKKPNPKGAWTWARPRFGLGGPIGARTDLFELLGCHPVMLCGPGRVEGTVAGGVRRKSFLPPSIAVVARWRNRETGRIVVVVNFHLTAQVQRGKDGYRSDMPKRVRRHKKERAALEKLIAKRRQWGLRVAAVGDSNYHHMPIHGLTGWWEHEGNGETGTEGDRAIDLVSVSWGVPDKVRILTTKSDHRHPVASWDGP